MLVGFGGVAVPGAICETLHHFCNRVSAVTQSRVLSKMKAFIWNNNLMDLLMIGGL